MLTSTPDAMRGRVAAIEGVFASSTQNQLGGLGSGVTTQTVWARRVRRLVGGGLSRDDWSRPRGRWPV